MEESCHLVKRFVLLCGSRNLLSHTPMIGVPALGLLANNKR